MVSTVKAVFSSTVCRRPLSPGGWGEWAWLALAPAGALCTRTERRLSLLVDQETSHFTLHLTPSVRMRGNVSHREIANWFCTQPALYKAFKL